MAARNKAPAAKKPRAAAQENAESLARKQREISVSEFFAKNRHLLGFDNPKKALLTTIKEAVDNALDACEECGILPEIRVSIEALGTTRFRVAVEDNGPGILPQQVPRIFAKLLYGSKFHSLRMSRGQQGIGISAAALYGQLTTGRPVRIRSRTSNRRPAHYYELHIDTRRNQPEIIKDETISWDVAHGTRVEIDLEGIFQRGRQSIDEYLEQTRIANPHLALHYRPPDAEEQSWPRSAKALPHVPEAIRPHPHGIELGILIQMLRDTSARTLRAFLREDFSRVSARVALEICERASLRPNSRPSRIARGEAESLYRAIGETKLLNPPTNCLSPIGEEQLLKGLQSTVPAEFFTARTRPPSVYRGNPFQVEVALAYGGEVPADGLARLVRYANRAPLLYQQGACAMTRSVLDVAWRSYGLDQSRGALPTGPLVVCVHMASVWVPFTSESKEAVAGYPEIMREIRLALQETGRRLSVHLSRRRRAADAQRKRVYIETYLPHLAIGLQQILGFNEKEHERVVRDLRKILERKSASP